MEQNVIQKNMWNTAAKAGLVLGLVSTIYMFINRWTGQTEMSAFLSILINGVMWCLKFGGCIWIMMFFMKKFCAENPEADNRNTRRLGTTMAFLSALVYSAFTLADVLVISPDFYANQIDQVMQAYAPMMDSNTLAEMDTMTGRFPQLTFFSNLIYCFIYGTILAAILSRNIPSKDPFASYKPDEQ
jgi:hypothetical protein